jgi:hypothetical protein
MNMILKILLVLVLIATPLVSGAAGRKADDGVGHSHTRWFMVIDATIDSLGAKTGCKNTGSKDFTTDTDDYCKVPAGMQIRFINTDVGIPVVDVALDNCRVCIAKDGVIVADTCVEIGSDAMNEAGEYTPVAPAPDWYGEGTEYGFAVFDTVGEGDCNAGDDLRRLSVILRMESRIAP